MKKLLFVLALFMGTFVFVGFNANASELDDFIEEVEQQEVIETPAEEPQEETQIEEYTETALDFVKQITKSEAIIAMAAFFGIDIAAVVGLLLGVIIFLKKKVKEMEDNERFNAILQNKENKTQELLDSFKAKLDEYGSLLVKRIDTLEDDSKAKAQEQAKAISEALEEATKRLTE